jgi:hypothetical protein
MLIITHKNNLLKLLKFSLLSSNEAVKEIGATLYIDSFIVTFNYN